MTSRVLADVAASITEFKANPMKVATSAHGEAVAVLNRNEPAFYCVPAAAYEALMDKLEDMELLKIAKERANEESISVDLKTVLKRI
ncbi:type II toxin-antitoxin system Phd/YefM family antitoxin [Marinomonas epiphytica]